MFTFLKNKKSLKKIFVMGLVGTVLVSMAIAALIVIPHDTFAQSNQGSTLGPPPAGTSEGPGFDIFDPEVWGIWFFNSIGLFTLQMASWGLVASGFLLETIIKLSVLDIGSYLSAPGVIATWKTFRDLANMAFIFIILYIAIGTILGTGGIDIRKMLVRVVIIALLLNFSMFFTKVAIDASNIVTIGFYNQIVNTPACLETTAGTIGGIGGAFVCKLGVTSILDPKVQESIFASTGGGIGAAFKQLMLALVGSVFISITSFILLAASIMFIVRLVSFIFLVFLSPLAFVAMALPSDSYSNRWKEPLISNCLFAPAVMALFWAVLQVASALPSPYGLARAIVGLPSGGPAPDMGSSLLSYGILISLIIASLVIAKEFGAAGAGGALSGLKSTQKWAQGKLNFSRQLNTARTWAQAKAGRGALRALQIDKLDKKLKDSTFGRTYTGKYFRDATTGAVTSMDFGHKDGSIQKVDKERKKIQEELAKETNKDLEKKLDKELYARRTARMAEEGDNLKTQEDELKKADSAVADMEKKVDTNENLKKQGVYIDEKVHSDNKRQLVELRDIAKTARSERDRIKNIVDTTKANRDANNGEGVAATRDEKNLWLTDLQRKKYKEFNTTRDEKAARGKVVDSEIRTTRRDISKLERDIATKAAQIAKAKANNWPEPTLIVAAQKANQDKLKELQKEFQKLITEKDTLTLVPGGGLVDKMLGYTRDRKKAAEELKKLYRSGGSKDISSALKDIVDEAGGGGGGGDKGGGGGAKT